MKITFGWIWFLPLLCAAAVIPNCAAQSRLGLRDAVAEALRSRASLAALAQEVSAAQGAERQARLIENPTFQFENQNLRPGMTYGTDVDTYAFLTQPLDILGKRKRRIQVAQGEVASAQADYELERRRIARGVAQASWAARFAWAARQQLRPDARERLRALRARRFVRPTRRADWFPDERA